MNKFVNCLLASLLVLPAVVWAEAPMKRLSHIDDRTVSFGYSSNQVYKITVHVGYLTQIEFSKKENIVDIGAGFDGDQWQTAQSAPHIFSLKPKPISKHTFSVDTDTNLLFTTWDGKKHRTYMFHIKVKVYDPDDTSAEPMIWKVKFWYPKAKARKRAAKPVPPTRPDILLTPEKDRNYDYYYSGNKRLVPGVAFDNGTFTFFRFSPDHDWPLIYAVDMNTGGERLVNTRREGPDVIVEGVYDILVLRYGQKYACVFNAARVTPKESRNIKPVLVRQQPSKVEAKAQPKGGESDENAGK